MARRVDNESRGGPKKPAEVYCLGAEVKGRAISAEAGPPRQPLIEVLASMPDVGLDADFERIDSVDHSAAAPFSAS